MQGRTSLNSSTRSLDRLGYSDSGSFGNLAHSGAGKVFKSHGSTFFRILEEHVEAEWERHVLAAVGDEAGHALVHTFSMFQQLYEVVVGKHTHVVAECMQLASEQLPTTDLAPLGETLDMLSSVQLPFVYVDTEALASAHLLDAHKSLVIQLHELWETFSLKRQDAIGCLQKLAASVRLARGGSGAGHRHRHHRTRPRSSSVTPSDNEALGGGDGAGTPRSLAKTAVVLVCRLHMVLGMMLGVYVQLVAGVEGIGKYPLMHNISKEVGLVAEQVQAAIDRGSSSIRRVDCSHLSKQRAIQSLESHLDAQQTRQALSLLHAFRKHWKNDIFGLSSRDDFFVLTYIFASFQGQRPGSFAVFPETTHLRETIETLQAISATCMRNMYSALSTNNTSLLQLQASSSRPLQ